MQPAPSILSRVRPARWSRADAAAYEATRRVLDEAVEECAGQVSAALTRSVPDRREAARWQAVVSELSAERLRLRPDRRADVRRVRDRCRSVLDDTVTFTRIRAAVAAGRAHAIDREALYVRYENVWWVRLGLGYVSSPAEIAPVIAAYALTLAAADAAVARAGCGQVA